MQAKLEGDFTLEAFESDEDFAKHLARNGYEDLSRLLEMSDEFSLLGKRDVRHIKRLVEQLRKGCGKLDKIIGRAARLKRLNQNKNCDTGLCNSSQRLENYLKINTPK